ncbi:thioredoxin-like domain-containing protein [Parabacteroides sp. PF5-6]|uniref:TlpA family protein disulfide reductase n=1 Tax=Parabacteroides sp. PF5-6 TaxID=1742403 RepID=UPI0024052968|nr:thioredoxin-like domain-containing protein [Parabacteroides sp. PF5-6]MDF9829653.1 hypothetical protein [Parabacteroides sp. PF5-6]
MRVRTYVLIASVAMVIMSSGSKEAKPTVGLNPGDLAPRIKSLENDEDLRFQNHSGHYTLLNFWAAYDAESRARNVRLMNEINKSGSEKLRVRSISLDENQAVFTETVKTDKLDHSTQFLEEQGRESVVYKEYRLHKGFTNYLINDKGVIVAYDLTPEKLAETLDRI